MILYISVWGDSLDWPTERLKDWQCCLNLWCKDKREHEPYTPQLGRQQEDIWVMAGKTKVEQSSILFITFTHSLPSDVLTHASALILLSIRRPSIRWWWSEMYMLCSWKEINFGALNAWGGHLEDDVDGFSQYIRVLPKCSFRAKTAVQLQISKWENGQSGCYIGYIPLQLECSLLKGHILIAFGLNCLWVCIEVQQYQQITI